MSEAGQAVLCTGSEAPVMHWQELPLLSADSLCDIVSLSGYFGVFHRLMVTRLRCVKGLSQSNFQAEIASIANSCSQVCAAP